VELFKSVRHMMAENRFLQAERILIEFRLQHEDSLPIEFFHELFEVRRHLGKDFPFQELDQYFIKLADKNQYQEIESLFNWWMDKNPSFESILFYQWKIKLEENKGMIQELDLTLKQYSLFLVNNKYWSHIEGLRAYVAKYFRNSHDYIFVFILYLTQTYKFSEVEIILEKFTIDKIVKSKMTAKTIDDIELIITLLDNIEEKGVLEIWKSFFNLYLKKELPVTEVKKIIEIIIYFESLPVQLLILRKMKHWGENDLSELIAASIKRSGNYDFVTVDKYFSDDLKDFFVPKKTPIDLSYISPLTKEDLALESKIKGPKELEIEQIHQTTEDEELIISGLKYQSIELKQGLELIVSMLQMSFPLAAKEIALVLRKEKYEVQDQLKINYLLLQIFHQLKDYRAALDIVYESQSLSSSSEDILAFHYAEAELHYLLKEKKKARSIYLSILSLVGNYRMTKERLKELNEI